MKLKIVADEYTIINTQGIRFVERIDSNMFGGSRSPHSLIVTYKGDRMHYSYPNAELRDKQFQALSDAMRTN